MKDDLSELENEIANLPAPEVRGVFDQRVLESISQIRSLSSQVCPVATDAVRSSSGGAQRVSSTGWQLAIACGLCCVSFLAGRFSDDLNNLYSPSKPLVQEKQSSKQPSKGALPLVMNAEPELIALVRGTDLKETIWGPSREIVWQQLESGVKHSDEK